MNVTLCKLLAEAKPRVQGKSFAGIEHVANAIHEEYYTELCRLARTNTDDTAEAEDAVAIALSRIPTFVRNYNGGDPFAYLASAVRNEVRNMRRGKYLRTVAIDGYDWEVEPQSDTRDELLRILNDGIATMNPLWRPVFIAYTVNQLSHAEIRDSLGLTAETVRKRLFFARKHMRTNYGAEARELF